MRSGKYLRRFLIGAVVSIHIFSAWGQTEIAGFDADWINPAVDLYRYDELFINIVDLRDINVNVIDENGTTVAEDIDEDTVEQMGYLVFSRFADGLDQIIPVNRDDVDTKLSTTKPSLVVNLKISSDFSVERQQALTRMLSEFSGETAQNPPGTLLFECRIFDLETGEEIASLTERQGFTCDDPSYPFSSPDDIRRFGELVNTWAKETSAILAAQKEKQEHSAGYESLLDDFSSK
ncbi:MAG: hypothetical protein JXD21_03560 [Candidatus Omnitrophica bacterium]|nr:hypothetical protein [Candidatus Omnitrophota bacterium]